jgi:peptidoglycan/xylan/chitin deacetylase (PgdA/CDA1 family)
VGLGDQVIERLIRKLNIPYLTQVWMEGNFKWLVRVAASLVTLAILVVADLVFDNLLFRVLWILNLVLALFLFRFTGLKNGLFVKPLYAFPGDGKNLALTFDDGPHPEHTPKLLEIMEKHGVHATFFLTGTQIEKHPDIAVRIAEKGHDIGSHGYSHGNMSRMSLGQLKHDFACFKAAAEKAGLQAPVLFRAPFGLKSPILEWYSRKLGLRMIHWNLSPKDWKAVPHDVILSRLTDFSRPGSIILLHDSPNAVGMLANYIQTMLERGYSFRRISDSN